MEREVQFYRDLEHLHIVTLIDSGTDEEALLPESEEPKTVHYVVTQLCKYGELLDFIVKSSKVDE